MKGNVAKAYEITDAKIQFVSLVGKAANKHTFLMAKAEDGKAKFTTYGRILKADAESHYVTGIVYEPMTEDTDGNFMTEEEIVKAAHWFAKNSNQVDIQHSFEPFENASVVESWVAKSDCDINGNAVRKGTWLMTVEVRDDGVWDAIQKGEITGFSMGGLGVYGEEDVNLSVAKSDKRGLLKQLAGALGFNVMQKGEVTEIYEERSKADMFWNAFDALKEVLRSYDYASDVTTYESDEDTIRRELAEFDEIITDLLAEKEPIVKSLYKARQGAEDTDDTANQKEELDMTKEEVEGIVAEAVKKAMEPDEPAVEEKAAEEPVAKEEPETAAEPAVTAEDVEKMVAEAVEKAMHPEGESLEDMVAKAVTAAVEPIMKSHGLPTNLSGEETGEVKKDETHYLHGIL